MPHNPRIAFLAGMLAAMAQVSPPDLGRQFLLDRGWMPLGAEAGTGVEGWGKVIGGQAVTVPIHEALALEGWRKP